ncbi:hypothetical protein PV755_46320 [Streptomyces caniscabiei]|uniref:Uncharacterized protein n=1 Tax=Streptomyces caniscabiei TaxID=2746961 RepID=A0A927L1Z4_9ACTN|nr:hypothetical protein [Streptomyces caniscabiei]MBD9723498.1 hypothetical protein [Streptomyces caniscabiei]MDX3516221.1 hypothetical protein [Streptomyces caniscabiei]MDX3725281.1 hypothetical protein [Streptomyces caniscabiei]WEO27069.1 hypothetical protein IHE65_30080 [Streptomyces caniscabiei]
MRFPFIPRAWHDADIADLNADRDRLRRERDKAIEDRDAFKYAAETASEKYTDTSIVNDCLTEDLVKVRARLAEYKGRRTVAEVLEEHDVHRKAIADALGDQNRHMNWDQLIAEVAGWVKAANAWMTDCAAEKKRADRLQQQYDNAVGLGGRQPEDSSRWQPGYKTPEKTS